MSKTTRPWAVRSTCRARRPRTLARRRKRREPSRPARRLRSQGDGDETATVERLTAEGTGYGKHTTFRLADFLTLPGGPEDEVDVEELAATAPTCAHFLDLDGLGVRDLCPDGADLLVLDGPSMDLDGPVRVYRWRDALDGDAPRVVRAPALGRELNLPFGDGDDHAEGIGLLEGRRLLVVVHDSPAPARLIKPGTVLADVVTL